MYTGKLNFDSGNMKSSVDLVVGVQELPTLFDMKTTSTKKYVLPGRIVSADIKLSNIGDSESVNAVLEYGIMDFNNVIYSSRTENIVVTKNIFTKKVSLKMPDDARIGRYIFYSKIIYGNKIVVSSDTFQVEQISIMMWAISLIMIIILILLVIWRMGLINLKRREKALKKK